MRQDRGGMAPPIAWSSGHVSCSGPRGSYDVRDWQFVSMKTRIASTNRITPPFPFFALKARKGIGVERRLDIGFDSITQLTVRGCRWR